MSNVTRLTFYRVAGPGTFATWRYHHESGALAAVIDFANSADGPNLWYVLENDKPIWRVLRKHDGTVRKFDIPGRNMTATVTIAALTLAEARSVSTKILTTFFEDTPWQIISESAERITRPTTKLTLERVWMFTFEAEA